MFFFYYQLKVTLAALDSQTVPGSLFDSSLPDTLECAESTAYLADLLLPPPLPPKRRASARKLTTPSSTSSSSSTHIVPNVPPTPIHSPGQQMRKEDSLVGRPDFRLGPIKIERAIDAEKTVDCGYGLVHLYRDEAPASEQPEALITSENEDGLGTYLAILAVPSYMATREFLAFIDTANVRQCRLIRDNAPNRYLAVLKFKDTKTAVEFYKRYNGKQFSSLEPEICHVVFLRPPVAIEKLQVQPPAMPYLNETLANDKQAGRRRRQIELPTCPVCLERMDESVTSLLTILCEHTFQCYCLSKWGDTNCPVCCYSQRPVLEKSSSASRSSSSCVPKVNQVGCAVCGSTESLWICMICGHIGCGRYQDAHAYGHFMETNHIFALEIETQRVWDYVGDGYVHRLIQNMVDGSLVELPSAASTGDSRRHVPSQEKLDALSLEYTSLLTSMLDSQRIYYEEQLDQVQEQIKTATSQIKSMMSDVKAIKQENEELSKASAELNKQLADTRREKAKAERRLESWLTKTRTVEREYQEEKEVTQSLLRNNQVIKRDIERKDRMIKELNDKIAQLMLVLEGADNNSVAAQKGPEAESPKEDEQEDQQQQQQPSSTLTTTTTTTTQSRRKQKRQGKGGSKRS